MAIRSQAPRRFLLETSQAIYEKGALRQVIVEAQDGFAVLRLRGSKTSFAIPWNAVFRAAAKEAAEREWKARRAEFEL